MARKKTDPEVARWRELLDAGLEWLKVTGWSENNDAWTPTARRLALAIENLTPKKANEPTASTGDGFELAKKFVELEERRLAVETQLDRVVKERDALAAPDGPLMTRWINDGLSKLRVDGRTIYLHRERWLFRKSDVTTEDALRALGRAHLKDFVRRTYNAQQLRSWLKEREAGGKPLPAKMSECFEVEERVQFRSRRS